MSFKYVTIIAFILNFRCTAQNEVTQIEIVQPTIDQEATSIWRTINDISFFESQGYRISLPKGSLINELIEKSKNGNFGNDDYPVIHSLLENEVFDQGNYDQAIQKVNAQITLMDDLIKELEATQSAWDWDFKMFTTYKVVFTLYGTGGSYDPDQGVITLLTNSNGEFMNYADPTNTIIHEIVHMGLEHSIVRKFDLSHGDKERIVDAFVYLMFKTKLPEYKIQPMGNRRIDEQLKTKRDLDALPTVASALNESDTKWSKSQN